jgi:hypothetical protein
VNWYLFVVGALLPWLLVGLCSGLAYLLLRQNGRMLLRLEALAEHLFQLKEALAARSTAPSEVEPHNSPGLPVRAPAGAARPRHP